MMLTLTVILVVGLRRFFLSIANVYLFGMYLLGNPKRPCLSSDLVRDHAKPLECNGKLEWINMTAIRYYVTSKNQCG